MPKRKREESNDSEWIKSKLKKLERKIMKTRRRPRVIESSASSAASSRESSPSQQDPKGGDKKDDRAASYNSSAEAGVDVHPAVVDRGPTSQNMDAAADPAAAQEMSTSSEDGLDSIVLEILGDDPSAVIQYGPDIHKDLASRFEHLATTGLEKNARKELAAKYLVPGNCVRAGAPILNAEIKAALPESIVKRDKAIEAVQKQIASTIACLAAAMTQQLHCKEKDHALLKKLMDTARLLCDIQYAESIKRRNFAMYALKRDMKEHLTSTKIDKYLFGENLSDALKAAKAVNKSGTDLKVQTKISKKPSPQNQKSQVGKPLNCKAPAPARRPTGAGAQRSQAPAPRRAPRVASSRPSPPPPKTARRR